MEIPTHPDVPAHASTNSLDSRAAMTHRLPTTILTTAGTGFVTDLLPSRALRGREVRVAVKAIGINPVDWKLSDNVALRQVHNLLGPAGPFVTGIDFAGVVTEVGKRATGIKVGDPVAGAVDMRFRQRGSYASEVIVADSQLALMPSGMAFATAAALPVAGVTAHMALFEKGRLDQFRDGKVLILGASGGVGHLAVQLAHQYGSKVYGVCSSKNAALVTGLGATVITHDEGDVFEKAALQGPYDLVVNAVSTTLYPVKQVAHLLNGRGRQVLLMPGMKDLPKLLLPGVTFFSAAPNRKSMAPLLAQVAAGTLKLIVSERFAFRDVEQAHRLSRGGRVVGKIVLELDDAGR